MASLEGSEPGLSLHGVEEQQQPILMMETKGFSSRETVAAEARVASSEADAVVSLSSSTSSWENWRASSTFNIEQQNPFTSQTSSPSPQGAAVEPQQVGVCPKKCKTAEGEQRGSLAAPSGRVKTGGGFPLSTDAPLLQACRTGAGSDREGGAQRATGTVSEQRNLQHGQRQEGQQEQAQGVDGYQREKMVQLLRTFMLAKHIKTDSQPCRVIEGLFVGSVGAAYNRAALKELGISTVVVVANSIQPLFPDDFTYFVVDVLDSPEVDLAARFGECFRAIDSARGAGAAALVHCFAGRSRSVTVVVAYLMARCGMSRGAALALVRSVRPEACPNAGFMQQLQAWEDTLRSARSGPSSQEGQEVWERRAGVDQPQAAPDPSATTPGMTAALAPCPQGAEG